MTSITAATTNPAALSVDFLFLDRSADSAFIENCFDAAVRDVLAPPTMWSRQLTKSSRSDRIECVRYTPAGSPLGRASLVVFPATRPGVRATAIEMPREMFVVVLTRAMQLAAERELKLPRRLHVAHGLSALLETNQSPTTDQLLRASFDVLIDKSCLERYATLLADRTSNKRQRTVGPDRIGDSRTQSQRLLAFLDTADNVVGGSGGESEPNEDEADADAAATQREHEFTDLMLRTDSVEPNTRFEQRFTNAWRCAVVLHALYYRGRRRLWRNSDHYYLHCLTLTHEPGERDSAKLDRIAKLIADRLAFQPLDDGRYAGSATATTADDVLRLMDCVADGASVLAPLTKELFTKYRLHRVVNEYHVRVDFDGRRAQPRAVDVKATATLIDFRRATQAELDAYIEQHSLERARCLLAARQPPLSVVLAFKALCASPLDLLSTMRVFAPAARTDIDYTIVWAPQAYAEETVVYVCMTQPTLLTVMLGGVPYVLASRRASGAIEPTRMLAAPLINAALASIDAEVRLNALHAVRVLLSAGGDGGGSSGISDARLRVESIDCVRNIDRVLSCFFGTEIDNVDLCRQFVNATLAGRSSKRRPSAVEPRGIYAALLAAVSGTALGAVVETHVLASLRSGGNRRFDDFIARQTQICAPLEDIAQRNATAREQQHGEFSKAIAVPVCGCGRRLSDCSVATQQFNEIRATHTYPFDVKLCCVCERVDRALKLEERCLKRRAGGRVAGSPPMCDQCSRLDIVVTPVANRGAMTLLTLGGGGGGGGGSSSNAGETPSVFRLPEIVEEFARRKARVCLANLRLLDGTRLLRMHVPRPLRSNTSARASSERSTSEPRYLTHIAQNTASALADLRPVDDRTTLARLLALIALESLYCNARERLEESRDDVLAAKLQPLDLDTLRRALDTRSVTAMVETSLTVFPLCESSLTASRPLDDGMVSFARDVALGIDERVARLTYNLSSAAPLVDAPPLLLPLALFDVE